MVGVQIPHHFRCPISLELMLDPMTVSTGQTYDRSNIEPWIAAGNTTCPVTRAPLLDFTLIPNHTLRRLIQSRCVANRHSGVERIPTPKQPADPSRVHALLSQATSTSSAAAGLIIFLKQDDRQGSGGHCDQLAGRRYAVLLRNPKAETPKGSKPWTGGGGRLHADASRRRAVPRPEAAMTRLELELWQTQEKRKEKWREKRGRKSRRQKRRGGERVKGREMELMEREWDAARWAQICHVSTFEWWYISPTWRVKPTQYFLP